MLLGWRLNGGFLDMRQKKAPTRAGALCCAVQIILSCARGWATPPRDDSRSFNRCRTRKCFSKYGPKISDLKQQKFSVLSGVMAAALECPLFT
jgi:hypothetical protein